MSPPILSVVIPTYNRRRKLDRTLSAIEEQRGFGGDFEILIVDDHSEDDTSDFLANYQTENPSCRAILNPGRGPAAARNAGIAEAKAERILLLGDDTRPAPGTFFEHLRHGPEVGVQGYIEWDPALPLTEIMEFLAPAGPQFFFKGLRDGRPIPYTAVLGSNYSAPKAWFLAEPFDEAFPAAAFEDTELAFRWQKRGWSSIYAGKALCWHDHLYAELAPFLARQKRAGLAARYALKRHPSMLRRVALEPLAYGCLVALRHGVRTLRKQPLTTDVWDLQCRLAFFKGLLPTLRQDQAH